MIIKIHEIEVVNQYSNAETGEFGGRLEIGRFVLVDEVLPLLEKLIEAERKWNSDAVSGCRYCDGPEIDISRSIEHTEDCPWIAARQLIDELGGAA